MKRLVGVILLLTGLWLGASQGVSALDCTHNSVTCLKWDARLNECGSANGDVAQCVADGTSCDWDYNPSLLDCAMCMPHGTQCYDQDNPTASPTPPPTGPTCAASGYPSCNGYCTGGQVCKAIAETG